jgi:hypothetical protein
MVNIKKFPRGILDQVISKEPATAGNQRASWSGPQASSLKLQAQCDFQEALQSQSRASSSRRQAFEPTCSSIKRQASSPRQQASSFKPQAASSVILEPRYMDIGEVLGGKGPRAFTIRISESCLKFLLIC